MQITPNERNEFEIPREVYDTAYCIYVHSINKGSEWVYVGLCRYRDVNRMPDAYTNAVWRARMIGDAAPAFATQVLMICTDHMDAQRERAKILQQYSPEVNKRVINIKNGRGMVTCVEGPNAGKTYMSQTDAAYQNGISQGALSNHLNGRAGYDTVHNMRFRKGM